MTCQEFWSRMPELESGQSGQQQFDHANQCAACAALLQWQRALSAGLRRMSAERHTVEAPAHLEAGLRVAFRTGAELPAASPGRWWAQNWPWVPAVAALLAVAIFVVWERQPVGPAGPPLAEAVSLAGDAEMYSGFIPLPYAEQASAPDDDDRVQVEMPRATLIALGLPMAEGDSGEAVEAEVLLGAGGTPQAIRLLE